MRSVWCAAWHVVVSQQNIDLFLYFSSLEIRGRKKTYSSSNNFHRTFSNHLGRGVVLGLGGWPELAREWSSLLLFLFCVYKQPPHLALS